jgi:hypothetical protein
MEAFLTGSGYRQVMGHRYDTSQSVCHSDFKFLSIIFGTIMCPLIMYVAVANPSSYSNDCWSVWYPTHILTHKSSAVTVCTTRFETLKPCILPTVCICVFRKVLAVNTDFFPLNSFNRLVFEAERWYVSCEVRNKFLYNTEEEIPSLKGYYTINSYSIV